MKVLLAEPCPLLGFEVAGPMQSPRRLSDYADFHNPTSIKLGVQGTLTVAQMLLFLGFPFYRAKVGSMSHMQTLRRSLPRRRSSSRRTLGLKSGSRTRGRGRAKRPLAQSPFGSAESADHLSVLGSPEGRAPQTNSAMFFCASRLAPGRTLRDRIQMSCP